MIDVQLAHKLGLIGYGVHARRLLSIIEDNPNFEISHIYHPKKIFNDSHSTTKIEELYTCDGIIIASPNITHFSYIEQFLKNSKCFIFCEKPPCVTLDETKKLLTLNDDDKKRIFFNFNFRFSNVSQLIKKIIDSKRFGKITHINIISAHGLAFKNDYLNSWRSASNNLHNILETVAIHYVDLMNFHFGKSNQFNYIPSKFSDNGNSFDTCNVLIEYDNHLTCSIFNSYASSYVEDIFINCTNGYVTIRNNLISEFHPRDTFDKNEHFITPPIINQTSLNMNSNYEISLKNSVNHFLSHLEKKSFFSLTDFEMSLATNIDILKMKNIS